MLRVLLPRGPLPGAPASTRIPASQGSRKGWSRVRGASVPWQVGTAVGDLPHGPTCPPRHISPTPSPSPWPGLTLPSW